MFSKLLTLILSGVFFLSHTSLISAAVYINEFLPNPSGPSSEDTEWIELYNSDSASVDLSGWQLDDVSGGSSPYTLPTGTLISGNGFLVFEKSVTNIGLNNTDDSVRLLNASGTEQDLHTYSSTTEDLSFGRTIDGGGSWTSFTSPTKSASNNSGVQVTPTPTPTPSPAPTNTNTPTPTKSPTNTPTPTQAITPSPTKKLTSTPTKTEEILSLATTNVGTEEAVLGLETNKEEETSIVEDKPGLSLGKSFIAGGFALIGLTFVGLSGYSLLKGRAEMGSKKSDTMEIHEDT